MKEQKKVKSSEIVQPNTLADLQVPDEQAQKAKGGADSSRSNGNTVGGVITYTYTVTNTSSV